MTSAIFHSPSVAVLLPALIPTTWLGPTTGGLGYRCHIRMLRSSEHEASSEPQGENTSDQTVDVCPESVVNGNQSSEGSST